MKNPLPTRPAATASRRAPYGAAPVAGFATSLGLRPPAVTHPATFSSRLTRASHPVCRAACTDKAAVALLAASGWQHPPMDAIPTGGELVERYLEPVTYTHL